MAARSANPNWCVAAGVNTAEFGSVYRIIRYKGCHEQLPYEVVISQARPEDFDDEFEFEQFVILRQSFKSLKEARTLYLAPDEREENPCC